MFRLAVTNVLTSQKLHLIMNTPSDGDILIISVPYLGSEYGQLSLETWTFLHDIYGGGPVFSIEGEKEIEEKQDQQEQEEEVQQE